MAKFVGFIGAGRGKAGNLVFSKGSKGETIARAYQPQVKNPRTEPQILQRAKMNLVGQMSGLIDKGALVPLGGGSALNNRSEFNRINLLATTAAMDEQGGATAKLAPENVKFSKGAAPLLSTMGEVTIAGNVVTIPVTPNLPSEDYLGMYGERVYIGILSAANNGQWDGFTYFDNIITSDSAQSFTTTLPNLEDGQTLVIWRVPFYLSPAGTSLFGQNIHFTSPDITARIVSNATTLIDYWGQTRYGGSVPFVAGS